MKWNIFKRTGCVLIASAMIAAAAPQVTDTLPISTVMTAQAASKSKVIKLKVKDGAKIGKALDDALLKASKKAAKEKTIYTVKVPKGTYVLDRTLHMFSNTTLDVTGCTLKSDKTFHNLLILGTNGKYKGVDEFNSSKKAKGYTSCVNVKIKGGTWVGNNKNKATPFRLAHAKNVTLEGMTIKGGNYACHQVETAAINGLYIRKCTFRDFKPINYLGKGHYECIQIDIPCSSKAYKCCYLDGTPSKNIEITNCKFTNVSRGVGTHSQLVGAYHDKIKITDNTFTNLQEEAIIALNYTNCTIARNKIVNAGGGILFENAKFAGSGSKIDSMYTTVFDGKKAYKKSIVYNVNSVIADNTMTIVYSKDCDRIQGIRVHGLNVDKACKGGDNKTIPKKNYYISGVTVKNNRITTAGYGIFIDDARNITCTGNTITQKAVSAKDSYKQKYDGIFLSSGCRSVKIENNKISGFMRNGIFIMTDSAAGSVKGNTISSCKKHGIYLYDSASAGNVTGNVIKSCTEQGIVLNTKCKAASITDNELSGFGGSGIYINQNSSVSGDISGNKVSSTEGSGIVLNNTSSVKNISGNTISDMGRYGIFLHSSRAYGVVKDNTLSQIADMDIRISSDSVAQVIASDEDEEEQQQEE
ncbi:MAG: right-handed parallel beta-helix repeat-containing protein [Ruminococcus sp.]|nr:right-handed parallel beta-helix repeat-containing protein [Ruminococcus sp.]